MLLLQPFTDVKISPVEDSNLTKATQLTNWADRARPQIQAIPIHLQSTQEWPDYLERRQQGGESEDERACGGTSCSMLSGRCVCSAQAGPGATVCFFLNSQGVDHIR